MTALARLEPWELYSRLYGSAFAGMLPAEFAAAGNGSPAGQELIDDFNLTFYHEGYGVRVLLPVLALAFALILILQTIFYLCGAFCLGLTQMNFSPMGFRNRLGVFIMASTIPAIAAALFGLWLPAVHIIVFYLAVIPLVFALIRRYNRDKEDT
jgi:maltodextrin utilization protein YvdJ